MTDETAQLTAALAELDTLLLGIPPAEAQLTLLKLIFAKVALIDGSLTALTPVIGAIAGKAGVTGPEIRRLMDMASETS